jgi:hypothetical protein
LLEPRRRQKRSSVKQVLSLFDGFLSNMVDRNARLD